MSGLDLIFQNGVDDRLHSKNKRNNNNNNNNNNNKSGQVFGSATSILCITIVLIWYII